MIVPDNAIYVSPNNNYIIQNQYGDYEVYKQTRYYAERKMIVYCIGNCPDKVLQNAIMFADIV